MLLYAAGRQVSLVLAVFHMRHGVLVNYLAEDRILSHTYADDTRFLLIEDAR